MDYGFQLYLAANSLTNATSSKVTGSSEIKTVLDPPGRSPRTWQLPGNRRRQSRTPAKPKDPRKPPLTRPRSFRDDRARRRAETARSGAARLPYRPRGIGDRRRWAPPHRSRRSRSVRCRVQLAVQLAGRDLAAARVLSGPLAAAARRNEAVGGCQAGGFLAATRVR